MSITEENQASWQDDVEDMPHRRDVIRKITKLLQARKVDPSPKWKKQLPFKARKLEEHIYRHSPSLESYVDETTLKNRLKRAALSITRQYRIEKAYEMGMWAKPSPRNSLFSSASGSFSFPATQPIEEWRPQQLTPSPEPSDTPVRRSSSLWEKASWATTSLWDVPSKPSETALRDTSSSQIASITELQELQDANRELQNEILENIRKQQEALRSMQNATPHIVPPSS